MALVTKKQIRLMRDLISEYGECAVVTRKTIEDKIDTDKSIYPCSSCITKDLDYRIGRGSYLLTMNSDPAKVKERLRKDIVDVSIKKDSRALAQLLLSIGSD